MIIKVAGENLELLPQRALYWPTQRMLIIADIHFGKAATFRARGIPVPHGTTGENIDALEQLTRVRDVAHILFLGDFFHAKPVHVSATIATLRAWRQRFAGLHLTLIRGNHDLHAGDPPEDLGITLVNEPYQVGPFAFCHHPDLDADVYVIGGHVHPVCRLSARGDSLRLPCFLFGEKRGILPSFGAFTGGYLVNPDVDERIFIVTDDLVLQIPRANSIARRG